ncbi:MAG: Cysteine-rich [Rhodospirillales bacterium]|nr:Cysteine-rich [Rhodospirillales bacterium]
MVDPIPATTCARCGAPMTCTPEGDCWCMALPAQLPLPEGPAACFCSKCLEAAARDGFSDHVGST